MVPVRSARSGALALLAGAAILVVLSATSALAMCPRVVFTRVDDKFVAIGWTMDQPEEEIEDFGGYRLWVKEVWTGAGFKLLREYVYGETDPDAAGYWPFDPYYVQPVRADSADYFQNAFPYEFSVTAFRASNPDSVNYECLEANGTGIVYPREGVKNDLAYVQVIPNPYRSSADWEHGGERRVTFVGLPSSATIRIYTVAADHVRTLRHDDPESDLEFWDLKNEDGEEVAPGIYIWTLDSDELGSTSGRMMIIK